MDENVLLYNVLNHNTNLLRDFHMVKNFMNMQ